MQLEPLFGLDDAGGERESPNPNHVYEAPGVSASRDIATENVTRYHFPHEFAADPPLRTLSFEDAGRALRRLRERRGWTLDDVAAMAGVAKMSISHLERGAKIPRPSTVAKIEAGLGWKSGSFYRLVDAGGDEAALDDLVNSFSHESAAATPMLPVHRIKGSEVMTAHVEAYIDMIDSLIEQLPSPSNPRFAITLNAALGQCGKVAALTASSWRMAALTDREAAAKLLRAVHELEAKRQLLLSRIPDSTAARFDAVCRRSELPEPLISVLTGLTTEESWSVRSGGTVPEGANARISAFLRSQLS
ncbi:helix-turn-helix domain-containing protein [Mycobacterium intracellulare]|uniref:helix-turn-helix domain-containing protein n=1 Tax=Mycobacterium intracellulare TaxID=1767 RepID=UPI001EED22F4|nr:helix-turn-helix transcriptional regulator [Mycobacterium intracellulare]MEE3755251.1 helix-turn-helix transcriptional regulator [Mycobacterium intracellulare]